MYPAQNIVRGQTVSYTVSVTGPVNNVTYYYRNIDSDGSDKDNWVAFSYTTCW
jgi:hypothetical protein